MKSKVAELFGIPIILLLLGFLFLVLGANGEKIATNLSRPPGATMWSTEGRTIDAFIFIPVILGISFLILFVSTFSISFYKWQKNR